jgi:RHS repeat-associated protein
LKVVQKWNPDYSTTPVIGSAINIGSLTMSKTTDYIGNIIYENGTLKRILIDGGYIEGGVYHYYLSDHLGNNRVVTDASGTVVQKNHYYPFGMAFAETPVAEQGKQPYKYNNKELDLMHGLNLYDNDARFYDPTRPGTLTPDPHAKKYPWISPYAWCANNPLRFIDRDGRDVKPIGDEALKMIHNTLTKEDIKFVRLDTNGNIDRDFLNSHKSESGNYNALSELVNSDILTEVSLGNSYSFMDNNGNMQTAKMSYQSADPEFADIDGSTLNGTTTGEAGLMGQTLLPGKGTSGVNSPDNSIKIIMNKDLSPAARAEMYSHEANGHALMYIRTGDRTKSGHIISGSKDTNTPLINIIKTSKMETVKNMRSR